MCDKDGLLGLARKDTLTPQQLEFMRDDLPDGLSLLDVAKHVKPTVLLGLSAQRGLFKEELVKEVAKHAARPFIFPLSNPTTSAECTAAEAYLWTHGRAIFASGSPFEPVTIHGKTYKPSQANNFFVFPVRGSKIMCVTVKGSMCDKPLFIEAIGDRFGGSPVSIFFQGIVLHLLMRLLPFPPSFST